MCHGQMHHASIDLVRGANRPAGRQTPRQGYYGYMDGLEALASCMVCLVMNLAKEGAWLRMLPRLSISNA